jgi:hypothetical protein
MERQTIESRYSSVAKVQLVLADLFPRNRFPQFFNSNRKGFDVDVRPSQEPLTLLEGLWRTTQRLTPEQMRMDKISFLAPRPLTEVAMRLLKTSEHCTNQDHRTSLSKQGPFRHALDRPRHSNKHGWQQYEDSAPGRDRVIWVIDLGRGTGRGRVLRCGALYCSVL